MKMGISRPLSKNGRRVTYVSLGLSTLLLAGFGLAKSLRRGRKKGISQYGI
jgi:hypothetical protein